MLRMSLNTNCYSPPDLPIPGLVEIPAIGACSISRSVYIMYAAVIALSFSCSDLASVR